MKNGHFIPEWNQVAEGEGLNDKPKRTVRGGASYVLIKDYKATNNKKK